MTNPAWMSVLMAARAQFAPARARMCQSTRYAILDSDEAHQQSILASMQEIVGFRPVLIDAAVPDGQIWLEAENRDGWSVVNKITLTEKA